jgi:hypothetical protein
MSEHPATGWQFLKLEGVSSSETNALIKAEDHSVWINARDRVSNESVATVRAFNETA